MASKLDRSWWRRAWKDAYEDADIAQFRKDLDSGLSPWVSYPDKQGGNRTLVEGLLRDTHWALGMLRRIWMSQVPDINAPPPGHLPVLHCLPVEVSTHTVEALLAAGADPLACDAQARLPLQRFIDRLIQCKPLSEACTTQAWRVAGVLLRSCGKDLSDLSPPASFPSWLDWGLDKGAREVACDETWQLILNGAKPDLDWTAQTLRGTALRRFLFQDYLAPSTLRMFMAAGLPLLSKDAQGNTFGHLVLNSPRMSYDGNPVAPIEALVEAAQAGMDFSCQNAQGFSVENRLAAILWTNEDEFGKIWQVLNARDLDENTAVVAAAPPRHRL